MNKIYKVVWCHVRNTYVVASELASRKKIKSVSVGRVAPETVKEANSMTKMVISGIFVGLMTAGSIANAQSVSQWNGNAAYSDGNMEGAPTTNAKAISGSSIAVGKGSVAGGETTSAEDATGYEIAFGVNAIARKQGAIAFGSNARATEFGALAFGNSANVSGFGSVALGNRATAGKHRSVVIGVDSKATHGRSILIGADSQSSGDMSTTLGYASKALSGGASTLGTYSEVAINSVDSIAIGTRAKVDEKSNSAIAMGTDAIVNKDSDYAIAIGRKASATKYGAVSLGVESITDGRLATAIGGGSKALTEGAVALGWDATVAATATNSIAIGMKSNVTAGNSIVIGQEAKSTGHTSVVMGYKANAGSYNTVVIGGEAIAKGYGGTAVGTGATADQGFSTAFGHSAKAMGSTSISIGPSSTAEGVLSTAIGNQSITKERASQAIGYKAQALQSNASALGNTAIADGSGANAIGSLANALANNATALGTSSKVEAEANNGNAFGTEALVAKAAINSTAIGTKATVSEGSQNSIAFGSESKVAANVNNAIAIGSKAQAGAQQAVAIGSAAEATGVRSFAFGDTAKAQQMGSVAFGNSANANAERAIAFGILSNVDGKNSIAFGNGSNVNAENALGLGLNTKISAAATNSVAIGSNSVVAIENAVSFGSDTLKRKLLNVAKGDVSANSYDAVNGSQLWAVEQKIQGLAVEGNQLVILNSEKTKVTLNPTLVSATNNETKNISIELGAGTNVTGDNSVAIGNNATIKGSSALALGVGAAVLANDAMAIGSKSEASGQYAIALGNGSKATDLRTIAIGDHAAASGESSLALGQNSNADAQHAVALGSQSYASGEYGIAVGTQAHAAGKNSIALGNAKAEGHNSVSIGEGSKSEDANSLALGSNSVTTAEYQVSFGNDDIKRKLVNVANGEVSDSSFDAVNGSQLWAVEEKIKDQLVILDEDKTKVTFNPALVSPNNPETSVISIELGFGANVTGRNSIAIGNTAESQGGGSIALGLGAKSGFDGQKNAEGELEGVANDAVAIGSYSNATGSNSLALGQSSKATGSQSIALGSQSESLGFQTVALGAGALASGDNGIAIGHHTQATGSHSFAFGVESSATATDTTAIGNGSVASAVEALALGSIATASGISSVALGSGANASHGNSVAFGAYSQTTSDNEVSFGYYKDEDDNILRRLTFVNKGRISKDSVDAINGSQLYATQDDFAKLLQADAGYDPEGKWINPDYSQALGAVDGPVVTVEEGFKQVSDRVNTNKLGIEDNKAKLDLAKDGLANALGGAAKFDANGKLSGVNFQGALGADEEINNVYDSLKYVNQQIAEKSKQLVKISDDGTTVVLDQSQLSDKTRSIALGYGAQANSDVNNIYGAATALGNQALALGASSTAIGDSANAKGAEGSALGFAASANAYRSTVMGSFAKANSSYSVAIGSGSTTRTQTMIKVGDDKYITETEYKDIINSPDRQSELTEIVKYHKANGVDIVSEVAFGYRAPGDPTYLGSTVNMTRKLTGVAEGLVSSVSKQAINGSQLFATNKKVADSLGGGSTVDTKTGEITGPTYNFTDNSSHTNVGSALTNLDNRVDSNTTNINNILDGKAGLVQLADNGEVVLNNEMTGVDEATFNLANKDGSTRQLTGVKDAELSATSTDAVNGSQLFATNEQVATNTTDIKNIDGRVTVNEGNIKTIDNRVTVNEGNIKTIGDRVTVNEGNIEQNTTDIKNIKTGEAGLVKLGAGNSIVIDNVLAAKADSFNIAQADGTTRQLTGVKDAELSATSTDAVNGSQLFATNEQVKENTTNIANNTTDIKNIDGRVTVNEGNIKTIGDTINQQGEQITTITTTQGNSLKGIENALGGEAKFDAEGNLTMPNYKDALSADKDLRSVEEGFRYVGAELKDQGDQITSIDNRVTINEGNIKTIGDRVTVNESNIEQNTTDIKNIQTGEAGLVKLVDDTIVIDNVLAAKADSFNIAQADGSARQLTGVKDAELSATSTDAVNGSQLFATNEQVAINTTDIKNIDGRVTVNEGNIKTIDNRVTVNEGNIKTIGDRVTVNEGDIKNIQGDISIIGDNINQQGEQITTITTTQGNSLKGIEDALGGEAKFDAEGNLTMPNYKEALSADKDLRSVEEGFRYVGGELKDQGDQITSIDNRVTINEGNIEQNTTDIQNIQTGEAGLVKLVDDTIVIDNVLAAKADSFNIAQADGTTRQLTGIKDAALTADSKDAVNGSQLFKTNQDVEKLGDRVTVNEGNIKTIDKRVTINEGNISNIQGDINNITAGKSGLVQLREGSDSVGNKVQVFGLDNEKGKDATAFDFANADGATRTLMGLSEGAIKAGSTEAVSGGQMYEIGLALVKHLDPEAKLNSRGVFEGLNYQEALGTKESHTSVSSAFEAIRDGKAGVLQLSEDGKKLVFSDIAKQATSVDFAGKDGAMKVTNVANGKVSSDSLDAINGSQLYAMNKSVSDALGGGSTIDSNGNITKPTYVINGNTYHNVGDAITNIDGRVIDNTKNITELTNNITSGKAGLVMIEGDKIVFDSSIAGGRTFDISNNGQARKMTGVADGSVAEGSKDAVNGGQLFDVGNSVADALGGGSSLVEGKVTAPNYKDALGADKDINSVNDGFKHVGDKLTNHEDRITNIEGDISNITNGTAGLVQLETDENGNQKLVIDNNLASKADTFDISNGDQDRTLTGVKDGKVESGSKDAINGGQLHDSNKTIADIFGGGASIDKDGYVSMPEYDFGNDNKFNNVGDSLAHLNNKIQNGAGGLFQMSADGKTVVLGDVAKTATTVDMGNRVIAGVANGKIEQGSLEAVNGGQLWETNQNVTSNTNQIKHINNTLNHYNTRINNLEKTVHQNRKRASAGTASAMAMSSIPYLDYAKYSFGMGVASYDGEAAMSMGLEFKMGDNGRFRIQGSYDTQNKAGVGVGMAFEL